MKKMLIMLVCMLVNVLGFVVVEPKVEEAAVAEAMFLVWFFVTKPEEEKEEAKREAWREAKRKLRNKNTREAIETIKEASIVIDNMVSNDMNSYFLEELYQDLETLYNEVVYNEVELDSIINVQVDMKNVIEYPHFMF